MAESKLGYATKVVRNASMDKFLKEVKKASKRSGKNPAFIVKDMIHCMRKFGAGYYDYNIFKFYELTDEQRDTYLTRFRSKKLIAQYNDESYSHIFDNKNEMNEVFKDYIGRQYVDMDTATREEIEKFYEDHDTFFCKVKTGECGHGAELLKKEAFGSAEGFYNYVKQKDFGTIEEQIVNHPDLAKVYPYSVNCMRMITLIGDDGQPHLLRAGQKFGRNGRIVDNYGVHGPVDLETGVFLYPAHPGDTQDHRLVTRHPNTGYPLIGFQVPCFQEAKEMVLKAAMVVPQMRYIGWDVAVTPHGPVIIEGNNYCAHDFWQLPGQTPGGIGIMPTLLKIIPSFKYK